MTSEEKKFWDGFTVTHDTMSVKIQIDKIVTQMMANLKSEYGNIIPRLTNKCLCESFIKASKQVKL